MPEYSYVKGDGYHAERRHLIKDENQTARWVINVTMVVALGCLVIYGIFGGRGWLAAGVFLTGGWIIVNVQDQARRLMYVLGSVESRLRYVEGDTEATIQDIESKNRREREQRQW